jgi:cathepsin L
VVGLAAAKTEWYQLDGYNFDAYAAEYGREYGSPAERVKRAAIFNDRMATIRVHNKDPAHTWKRGVNHLTDRTVGELAALHGLDRSLLFSQHNARTVAAAAAPTPAVTKGLPDHVDWREKNVITPVKNQGECGSCWTFASVETLESHWALAGNALVELSEQFVLDCTPNPQECGGTGGCMGGTGELAYNRIKELGGIPSEWTYPYVSILGNASTCHGLPLPPATPHKGGPMASANVTGFASPTSNSYAAMLEAVATKGPLAISVDAGDWHDYESGIFAGGNHTNPELDHLVQLVGYGSEDFKNGGYWLVRNSWTPLWGDNGYIKLAREKEAKDVSCGLDINPADGNGCKDGPATVKVCGQNGMLFDGVYPIVG